MNKLKRIAVMGAAIVLLSFSTGCLMIPLPAPMGGRYVTRGWRNRAQQFQESKATRAEVVEALGRPHWDYPDIRVVGYAWSGVEWGVFKLIPTEDYSGPEVRRLLWLGFDDRDRVVCWKVRKNNQPDPHKLWLQARAWRQSQNIGH